MCHKPRSERSKVTSHSNDCNTLYKVGGQAACRSTPCKKASKANPYSIVAMTAASLYTFDVTSNSGLSLCNDCTESEIFQQSLPALRSLQ
eukprot:UN3438